MNQIPKMTLNVTLVGEKEVTIKLLHVCDIFANRNNKLKTENHWIYEGGSDNFSINMVQATIHLPRFSDADKDIEHFSFSSNRTRHLLLKDFNKSLYQWSSDYFFKASFVFHKTPHIKYNGKLWIIF